MRTGRLCLLVASGLAICAAAATAAERPTITILYFDNNTGSEPMAALGQQLVARLVDGLAAALARTSAEAERAQKQRAGDRDNRLPDLDLAVEYGRALDLADRGDVEGEARLLEKIDAAAPGFVLGRTRLI